MNELAPGWPLVIEETTENHCIAVCGDVVLVFPYEGSHADVRHAETALRVIQRQSRQRQGLVRLLAVMPATHSKAPTGPVRDAILEMATRHRDRVSAAAVVMPGSGFSAAIHRGVLTGMVALLRFRSPPKVTSDLREALVYLVGEGEPVLYPLLRFCEERRNGVSTKAG